MVQKNFCNSIFIYKSKKYNIIYKQKITIKKEKT